MKAANMGIRNPSAGLLFQLTIVRYKAEIIYN
jgi:hypothetical protein